MPSLLAAPIMSWFSLFSLPLSTPLTGEFALNHLSYAPLLYYMSHLSLSVYVSYTTPPIDLFKNTSRPYKSFPNCRCNLLTPKQMVISVIITVYNRSEKIYMIHWLHFIEKMFTTFKS